MTQINHFYQIAIEDYHSPMSLMFPVSMQEDQVKKELLERGDEYLINKITKGNFRLADYVIHKVDAPSIILFKDRSQKITSDQTEFKEIHI